MLKNVMQQCSSTINYYVPPLMRKIYKKIYSNLKSADDRGVCGAYFFNYYLFIFLYFKTDNS